MNRSAADPGCPDLGAVFDAHVRHEFVDHDVDATMRTMTDDPYVHHVPVMTGGVGRESVREFYTRHFVHQLPPDANVELISRTVSADQVVDELIVSFTHTTQLDFMFPGVPPTGRRVEVPHVVVMRFEGGKIAHEHIYWDQASALVQIGLLDASKLPVAGVEQARRLRELAQRRRA